MQNLGKLVYSRASRRRSTIRDFSPPRAGRVIFDLIEQNFASLAILKDGLNADQATAVAYVAAPAAAYNQTAGA